MNGELIRR